MEIQMLCPDKYDQALIVYERRLITALAIPTQTFILARRTGNLEFAGRMYRLFYRNEEAADV